MLGQTYTGLPELTGEWLYLCARKLLKEKCPHPFFATHLSVARDRRQGCVVCPSLFHMDQMCKSKGEAHVMLERGTAISRLSWPLERKHMYPKEIMRTVPLFHKFSHSFFTITIKRCNKNNFIDCLTCGLRGKNKEVECCISWPSPQIQNIYF